MAIMPNPDMELNKYIVELEQENERLKSLINNHNEKITKILPSARPKNVYDGLLKLANWFDKMDEIDSNIDHVVQEDCRKWAAEIKRTIAVLCAAFKELNTIRARDGIPYKSDGTKSSVTEEYFDYVVNECAKCLELFGLKYPFQVDF